MLGLIRCLILPHRPNRRQVKKLATGDYIGYCAYCHGRIRRLKRDRWVRDWQRTFGRATDDGVACDVED